MLRRPQRPHHIVPVSSLVLARRRRRRPRGRILRWLRVVRVHRQWRRLSCRCKALALPCPSAGRTGRSSHHRLSPNVVSRVALSADRVWLNLLCTQSQGAIQDNSSSNRASRSHAGAARFVSSSLARHRHQVPTQGTQYHLPALFKQYLRALDPLGATLAVTNGPE
jgi:hypothetical protein